VYDPDKFISGPKLSEASSLNLDLLEFEYRLFLYIHFTSVL